MDGGGDHPVMTTTGADTPTALDGCVLQWDVCTLLPKARGAKLAPWTLASQRPSPGLPLPGAGGRAKGRSGGHASCRWAEVQCPRLDEGAASPPHPEAAPGRLACVGRTVQLPSHAHPPGPGDADVIMHEKHLETRMG